MRSELSFVRAIWVETRATFLARFVATESGLEQAGKARCRLAMR
jgi:hypothetical protein